MLEVGREEQVGRRVAHQIGPPLGARLLEGARVSWRARHLLASGGEPEPVAEGKRQLPLRRPQALAGRLESVELLEQRAQLLAELLLVRILVGLLSSICRSV